MWPEDGMYYDLIRNADVPHKCETSRGRPNQRKILGHLHCKIITGFHINSYPLPTTLSSSNISKIL
jgi:hypothetical protein